MTTLIKTPSSDIGLFRSLSPKDLASRLCTSEDMVRIFLRKNYAEVHTKKKRWSIRPQLARQIEKDYRNLVQAREAERKLRIEKELSGELQ